MYACMRVCVMCVCMHSCMYVCMYACMQVCRYAGMNVCMYVCMYVCMHACMHACVHACMYYVPGAKMYTCICIHIDVRTYVYIHMTYARLYTFRGVFCGKLTPSDRQKGTARPKTIIYTRANAPIFSLLQSVSGLSSNWGVLIGEAHSKLKG